MRKTILLIDDDAATHILVGKMLEGHYDVAAVFSVDEAFRLLEQGTPDLVLCDIAMPVHSGIDFLRFRSTDPALKSVPVVTISATGVRELITEALEMGADACITKPFNRTELLTTLGHILGSETS